MVAAGLRPALRLPAGLHPPVGFLPPPVSGARHARPQNLRAGSRPASERSIICSDVPNSWPTSFGTSLSFQVVYFFHNEDMPIYLLTVFAKNQRANLTKAEQNSLKTLTQQLVSIHKERSNG